MMAEELPIRMLKNDHRKVEEWFVELRQTNPNDQEKMLDILQDICKNLKIHMEVEEQLVYGEIENISPEGKEMIVQSLKEHQLLKDIIKRMGDLEKSESYIPDQVQELESTMTEHVKREEDRIFVFAQKYLGDKLGMGLSAKMFALKERLRLTM